MVEVKFKANRKAYFEWHEPEPLRPRDPVIVESERGLDYGVVNAVGELAQKKCDRCMGCALGGERERDAEHATKREPEPTRKVLRRASSADRKTAADLRKGEDDVRRKVKEKVSAHKLPMKVSDAEWQWDRNKLTVYFTAEKRVDFRNLVRELASQFRTRIELRQIGVRDEAARISGIGRCGRELCSASWLPELRPIGLHIAKDQRLSLNPAQISGPCGRLLCCLRYEHEFYVTSRKRFPKEGKVLQTAKGFEKVYSVDIFRDQVTLRAEDGTSRVVPLVELKAEVAAAGGQAIGVAGAAGSAPAERAAPPGGEAGRESRPAQRPPRRERDARPPRQDRGAPPAPQERPAAEPAASGPEPAGATPPGEAGEDGQRRRRRRRKRRRGPRGPGGPGGPGGAGDPGNSGGGAPDGGAGGGGPGTA